jgi:hypothetical protein
MGFVRFKSFCGIASSEFCSDRHFAKIYLYRLNLKIIMFGFSLSTKAS